MTNTEFEKELEQIDRLATSNNDMRAVAGAMVRGIWQIAYQLSQLTQELKDNHDHVAWETNQSIVDRG